MPLPLREPFFLKGRTSVVQRGVIMSLVLGGLACVAGWTTGIAVWVLIANSAGHKSVVHASTGVWAIATTAMIYGPMNFWNRRTWLWNAPALLFGYISLIVTFSVLEKSGPFQFEPLLCLSMVVLAAVSGLLLIRHRKLHFIAWGCSVCSATLPSLLLFWLTRWLQTPFSVLFTAIIGIGIVNSWLCSLAIPWGIPFWWPPEKDG